MILSLGDRVRIGRTDVTGRLMMIDTEHHHGDQWTPAKVVFDDGAYGWFNLDDIDIHRGYCEKCGFWVKAPEGGTRSGHHCAKYSRCDEELVYQDG